MQDIAVEIDRIVREVLAEKGLLPQAFGEVAADASRTIAAVPEAEPAAAIEHQPAMAGDVIVSDRVVTLAGVGERLASARRLLVPPRAVVTPAVQDELRRRKIALVFEEARSAPAAAAATAVVAVLGSRIDPAPVIEELNRAQVAVDLRRFECLIKATDELAGRLAAGNCSGILLSNYPAVALCLANRHGRVRAIVASDASQTAADAASVGANLLVIQPRSMTEDALRRISAWFCRQGPGHCPEALRERLD